MSVDFVLGDVLEADMEKYGGFFDVVFMEGGILHYFTSGNSWRSCIPFSVRAAA
ncbi:MAG: hypothetical protein ACLVLH_16620 [Eisenbergiella massiliensis]